MATSRIEVDLLALGRNLDVVREVLEAGRTRPAEGGAPVKPGLRPALCGVVKQDAYGLGADRIGKKLAAAGAEMLAVYCVDEARELVEVPVQIPVLVLMPVRKIDRADPIYRLAVRDRLHLVVHDLDQAKELALNAAQLGVRFPVHVQLDTGMARGGCLEAEATAVVEFVKTSQRLSLAGVMTHFASPASDEAYTKEQARAFRTWFDSIKPMVRGGPPVLVHAANTAAVLRGRSLHGNMVRVGQGLYGFGAEGFTDALPVEFASFGKRLQPVMRWVSRIVHIHEVPKGATVGYGRTFKAQRATRVALVPVGYADGYPIALSNVGRVALTGQQWDRPKTQALQHTEIFERPAFVPVVGRVSMDQITIDVTGIPDRLATVGAEVELVGKDPHAANHLPVLASQAGSITHEMLCKLCPHIERVYTASAGADGAQGPITMPRSVNAVAV